MGEGAGVPEPVAGRSPGSGVPSGGSTLPGGSAAAPGCGPTGRNVPGPEAADGASSGLAPLWRGYGPPGPSVTVLGLRLALRLAAPAAADQASPGSVPLSRDG